MARIIPAKPKMPKGDDILLILEEGLDDSHAIIQQPDEDVLFVLQPHGCVLLQRIFGEGYDFDTEEWDDSVVKADQRLSEAMIRAFNYIVPFQHLVFVPDMKKAPVSKTVKAILTLEDILPAVKAGLEIPTSLDVSLLMGVFYPEASPYVKGEVTEAQLKWRASKIKSPVEVQKKDDGNDEDELQALADEVFGKEEGAFDVSSELTPTPVYIGKEDENVLTEDNPIMILLQQTIDAVADGYSIWVSGIQITNEDVVSPTFLLPALLIAAAEDWAPIVLNKEGRGGFLIRMESDGKSLTGYRVVALTPATPFLMILPIIHRLRRSLNEEKGEIELNSTVAQFIRWLEKNQFDTSVISDIDVRVALDCANRKTEETEEE